MGFIAPALPWIAKGAGVLGGALLGQQRQKAVTAGAQRRSPEEQAALAGAGGAAGTLTGAGSTLAALGQTTQAPATNYYSTLLRGNRAAQAQATAAPRAAISDVYAGAERGLERMGRAPTTQARAELQREHARSLAGLVTGVQPQAAAALTGIGQSQIGQGLAASQAGGSIYGDLLGQAAQNRQQGQQVGREAGAATSQAIGEFLFDLISGFKRPPPVGGGGGVLPSRPVTFPAYTGWIP